MATSQLTASSVIVSARNLASFEGLRPSSLKFSSFGILEPGAFTPSSFKPLVVNAPILVAPKVIAIGPGSLDEEGNRKPPSVGPANTVLYSKHAGNDLRSSDGTNYYIALRASDVMAVLS